MKFRNIPALITLLAAFVACIVMIRREYSMFDFLTVLALVLVMFFMAGLVIRFLLNLVFKKPEKADSEEDNKETEEVDSQTEESKA